MVKSRDGVHIEESYGRKVCKREVGERKRKRKSACVQWCVGVESGVKRAARTKSESRGRR